MSTPKQTEANRRNAQKSTGPRSESGRRTSSLNAYKHGLTGQLFVMTAEEAESHHRYTASMIEDLKPVGVMEETLARSIADSHWRLNRAVIIENNIFAAEAFNQEAFAEREATKLGAESQYNDVSRARAAVKSFLSDPHRFHLLTVYEARLHRKAQADVRQLRELQAARRVEEKAGEEKVAGVKPSQNIQRPPAPQPEPLRPAAVGTQTPDLEDLNPPNGFVCSPLPTSEREIEEYIMVDPRRAAQDVILRAGC